MAPEEKTDIKTDDIIVDDGDDFEVDLTGINPNDVETITKPDDETQQTYESLPEGFDPAKYGLTANDEVQKLQGDLQRANEAAANAEVRMQDTQRSFHENQNQMAQLQNQFLQQQQQPQLQQQGAAPSSQQLLQQYQREVQLNDPNSVNTGNAYQQALTREQMQVQVQPQIDTLQQQVQQSMASMQAIAERSAFFQNPENQDINQDEMNRSFNVQQGGSGGTISEQVFLFRARQAGGIKNYVKLLERQGADKLVAQIKSGKKPVNTVTNSGIKVGNKPPGSEEFDYPAGWTDEQIMEYEQKRKEEGY